MLTCADSLNTSIYIQILYFNILNKKSSSNIVNNHIISLQILPHSSSVCSFPDGGLLHLKVGRFCSNRSLFPSSELRRLFMFPSSASRLFRPLNTEVCSCREGWKGTSQGNVLRRPFVGKACLRMALIQLEHLRHTNRLLKTAEDTGHPGRLVHDLHPAMLHSDTDASKRHLFKRTRTPTHCF